MIIAVGAAIGANARYWIGYWVTGKLGPAFPYSTLGINVAGSLILGAFLSAAMATGLSHQWRLFVAVGLCGGFTTFSAFSADTVILIEEGAYVPAFLYVLGSCVLSIAGCFAGAHLVRSALGPH